MTFAQLRPSCYKRMQLLYDRNKTVKEKETVYSPTSEAVGGVQLGVSSGIASEVFWFGANGGVQISEKASDCTAADRSCGDVKLVGKASELVRFGTNDSVQISRKASKLPA